MMDKKMRKEFDAWQARYWKEHTNYPNGRKCVEWALEYLRSQQEPEFYTSKNQIQAVENGANRYVMAREARWIKNPTENDVALYAHPVPSAPAALEVTESMVDAFWSKAEVTRVGSIIGLKEAIKAAMLAVAPAPSSVSVPEWQPIETAPKDGTLILVREDRCSGVAVMWAGGWKYETYSVCYLEPTHWMPLPAAPSHEKKENNHE